MTAHNNSHVTPEQVLELMATRQQPVRRLHITRGDAFLNHLIDDAIARGFLQEEGGGLSFTQEFIDQFIPSGPTVA